MRKTKVAFGLFLASNHWCRMRLCTVVLTSLPATFPPLRFLPCGRATPCLVLTAWDVVASSSLLSSVLPLLPSQLQARWTTRRFWLEALADVLTAAASLLRMRTSSQESKDDRPVCFGRLLCPSSATSWELFHTVPCGA